MDKHPTKAPLLGKRLERSARIGNRHAVLTSSIAEGLTKLLITILTQRADFNCRAGFAGYQDERAFKRGATLGVKNGRRIGAVQDSEIQPARGDAEGCAAHFSKQAASAHP